MKKALLNKIKASLMKQREELQTKPTNNEVDPGSDEVDVIQAKIILTIASQLSSRDKEKLVQIERTLNKIQQKTFGSCEECGEAIAEKRLEINPCYGTCISCAEQIEMNSKQVRR